MKVAVFTSHNGSEIIILEVKGKTRSKLDIDGYSMYFGIDPEYPTLTGRNIADYSVEMGHIGSGSGLNIRSSHYVDHMDNQVNIEDWFPEFHEE